MGVIKIVCWIGLFVILILCFIAIDKNIYNKDSIGSKKEWANLQTTDQAKLIKQLNNIKIITFNGSEIIMVGKQCNILLNPKYPPYFKSMGDCADIYITKDELNYLLKNTKITPTVYNILLFILHMK